MISAVIKHFLKCFPKQHSSLDSDLDQRFDEFDIFTSIALHSASDGHSSVRRRAILLHAVPAFICNGSTLHGCLAVTLGPKTFSSVIVVILVEILGKM